MHSLKRRELLKYFLCAGATCAVGSRHAFGQASPSPKKASAPAVEIDPQTKKSIARGLAYLARQQNEDGSFRQGMYGRNVATCSFAGMAFMAAGNTPGRGRYGRAVSRCVDYIASHVQESGYIAATDTDAQNTMYGHGFATLFLAEAYGMTQRADVGEKLRQAVKLIINTQNAGGGWRYEPERVEEADISVTICEVMALRAARNAGIFVPSDTIARSLDYIKKSQNTDGGFMYQLSGGESDMPRSAGAIVALYSAGIYEGEEIDKGIAYLMRHLPNSQSPEKDRYFFYGQYYAAQAMFLRGGEQWRQWYPASRDLLLSRQNKDGSWTDDSICDEYGTAMACITLQMPNNYLPIFQR